MHFWGVCLFWSYNWKKQCTFKVIVVHISSRNSLIMTIVDHLNAFEKKSQAIYLACVQDAI